MRTALPLAVTLLLCAAPAEAQLTRETSPVALPGYSLTAPDGPDRPYPWGTEPPTPRHGNFDFQPIVYRGPYEYGSPEVDIDYYPQTMPPPEEGESEA